MRAVAIALVALCLGTAGAGATPMLGFGVHSCGEYLDLDRSTGREASDTVFGSWALGFMSATNIGLMQSQGRYHDLQSMPAADQMARIRDYCTAHPDKKFWQGVIDLYNSLPMQSYTR